MPQCSRRGMLQPAPRSLSIVQRKRGHLCALACSELLACFRRSIPWWEHFSTKYPEADCSKEKEDPLDSVSDSQSREPPYSAVPWCKIRRAAGTTGLDLLNPHACALTPDLPDLTLLAFQARREDDTMAATRPHVLHHHLRLVGRAMLLQPRSHRQRIASLGVDRFLRCS